MATRTISPAGGSWATTGAWVEGVVPTAADDVVATASSGNLTITATGNCRSIDLTNFVGTFTHQANINVGTTTVPVTNIAVKFPTSGWTYSATQGFTLINSNATATTFDLGGKTITGITLTGRNTLASAMAVSGIVVHTAGVFDTGNFNISCLTFTSTGATARTLTLGSSIITCGTGDTTATRTNGYTGSNLTLNLGTSKFILNEDCIFACNSVTWYDIAFRGLGDQGTNSLLQNATTLHNLEYEPGTGTVQGNAQNRLGITGNVTVTNLLKVTGFSRPKRAVIYGTTVQVAGDGWTTPSTQTTIAMGAAGTTALTNVDFFATVLTGTNAPFSGTAVGNCHNCSGITFDTPRTLYWVGGETGGTTNTFGDASHWSLTSGGTGGQPCPLPQDTATFNTSSGFSNGNIGISADGQTVGSTLVMSTAIIQFSLSMNNTYLLNDITMTGSNRISGTTNAHVTLRAGVGTTMHLNGFVNNGSAFWLDAPGGVALTGSSSGTGAFVHRQGKLSLGSFTWSNGSTYVATAGTLVRELDFGSGTWAHGLAAVFQPGSAANNFTLTRGTGTFNANGSTGTVTLTPAGQTFPNITVTATTGGSIAFAGGTASLTCGSVTVVGRSGLDLSSLGALNCTSFTFSGASAGGHTFTGGSCAITCTSFSLNQTGTQVTWTGGTSTITVNPAGNDAFIDTAGATFPTVTVNPATGATYEFVPTGTTFGALTITGPASTTAYVSFRMPATVTGALTINGNSPTNRLLMFGPSWGGNATLTAATTTLSNVDLTNIIEAGAAAWTGTSITNSFTGWTACAVMV